MGRKKLNLAGQRFGRLIVIEENNKNKYGNILWKCKCDCGNIKIVSCSNLVSNNIKSCGCLQKENRTKHNLYKHSLYAIWYAMKGRCYNQKHKAYKNYGARGIKICNEWLNDFKKFYDFCINNGWKKGLQIDREDNNGNYEPDNCRFITSKKNTRNTKRSKIWVINGVRYPSVRSAGKKLNVSFQTIKVWCGVSGNNGKPPKAKPGCYAYNKY